MLSYTKYYRERLDERCICLESLDKKRKIFTQNITGKKRKYEEAMGYSNDYLVVQEPETTPPPRGTNWIDSYLDNLSNGQKSKL